MSASLDPSRAAPRGPRRRALVRSLLATLVVLGAGALAVGVRSDVVRRRPLSCRFVACVGVLQGAPFRIELPARWNGTLVLYAHGYRAGRGGGRPAATAGPDPEVVRALVARGYALAGSSYVDDGWALPEGIDATRDLLARFRSSVARPKHVLLWGVSMGGLIADELATDPKVDIDGALLECSPLAGTERKLAMSLDVAYAARQLFISTLPLARIGSSANATKARDSALAALSTRADRTAILSFLAALDDLPSAPAALATSVEQELTAATLQRADIERRVGGNPSSNLGIDYAERISAAERSRIDALVPGFTERALDALEDGQRVVADDAATTAIRRLGAPTGRLRVPTVVVHSTADPTVPSQHSAAFGATVQRAGAGGDLVRVVTSEPGHCRTAAATRVAAIDLLATWAARKVAPTPSVVRSVWPGSTVFGTAQPS